MAPEIFTSNLDALRFVWRILKPREKRQLAWLNVLALLMAVSTLGGVAAVLPFFSVLADPAGLAHHPALARAYQGFEFSDPRAFLVALGIAFIAVVVVANAINLLGTLAINRFALRIGREFHVSLFDEYLHRDYLFHALGGAVPLLNNVIFESTRVATGIVQGGLTLAAGLLSSVFILATAVAVDPKVALGAAILIGGSYGLIYLLTHRRLARNGLRETQLWDARIRTLTESFGSIQEIRLRGNQAFFRDSFAAYCDDMAHINARTYAIANGPKYVLDTITAFGLVAAALWLSRDGATSAWLAELSFFGLAAYRLLPAMQQCFATMARMRSDRVALQRIAEDLKDGRQRVPPPSLSPEALAPWTGSPRREIVAEQLCFRYAPGDALAVRNASLTIAAGQCVGFVGLNGSGKTTLSALLLGLLTPESGVVRIDGRPLTDDTRRLWQSTIAFVPQNVFLLDASIADNIAFGVPAHEIDAARLAQAVSAAKLDDLIAASPGGLAHRIGERGTRVSGGQRQRIGIARALYRRASFLVLDEATNALDGLAETEIVAAIDALRTHATVAVIAHRMSSVRNCDVIFEMEAGAIVGHGRFEELLRDSTRFRDLARRA
jgi:ABC-type multidrug transport system fused ATPase/permease subunit